MKRLLLINSVCGIRSTGCIAAAIAKEYDEKGWDVKFAYGRIAYRSGLVQEVGSKNRQWD